MRCITKVSIFVFIYQADQFKKSSYLFVRYFFFGTFTASNKIRGKMLRKLFTALLKLTLTLIIVSLFSITISSCGGGSQYGCYNDLSKYQKKSKRKDASNLVSNPKPYKHSASMRKKWVINNSRKPILGHRR